MKDITVTLTEHQINWIRSTIEHDMMFGSQDEAVDTFRHRLLTKLAKALAKAKTI